MARIQMVMTRGKDDEKALYDLLGNKDERKKFDTQFKKAESNFKIAIVVDMWLTGFDPPSSRDSGGTSVPFLDTMLTPSHRLGRAYSPVLRAAHLARTPSARFINKPVQRHNLIQAISRMTASLGVVAKHNTEFDSFTRVDMGCRPSHCRRGKFARAEGVARIHAAASSR